MRIYIYPPLKTLTFDFGIRMIQNGSSATGTYRIILQDHWNDTSLILILGDYNIPLKKDTPSGGAFYSATFQVPKDWILPDSGTVTVGDNASINLDLKNNRDVLKSDFVNPNLILMARSSIDYDSITKMFNHSDYTFEYYNSIVSSGSSIGCTLTYRYSGVL